jgi:hypothetical protein
MIAGMNCTARRKPFALSLSKGRPFFAMVKEKGRASTGSARTGTGRFFLFFVAVLLSPGAVSAQTTITSAGPDKVGVTIYRNPNRGVDDALDLDNLRGFALISETRTVDLPPGPVTIRFEGVASGIVPQSALIFGADIREKNRDAALLSERGLLDAFTGQRVILRRNNPATGKFTEEAATIRSGIAGVVVQTARGVEPVYCTGLDNDLIFPNAPQGLSAKPTLSMTTKDQPGGRRTITLVYLSQRFDWQANYVGEFSADASELNLFAWLTMASSDDTSFLDAQAAAVAGKVNREETDDGQTDDDDESFNRNYNCWPTREAMPPPPMPVAEPALAAPMMMRMEAESASIVVSASKIAQREDLGDLKLYRIPMPVTVAARAQKQVAFLSKSRVKGALIYRAKYVDDFESIEMLFRVKNNKANGLGEPLPAGKVALFQQAAGQRMLVGETSLVDKAVDEDVDLVFGEANNVSADQRRQESGTKWDDERLTIRNANPVPVRFEAEFPVADEDKAFGRFSGKMLARPGKLVWAVTVPANGLMTLNWRETEKN